MNKIVIFVIVVIVLLLAAGGYYWYAQYSSAPTYYSTTQQTQTEQPAQSGQASISIKDFAFSPSMITITAGSKVTWTNNDSMAHTITSSTFNSGNVNPGGSFQYTFNQKGTYHYSCSIHPSMQGNIIVN